MAEELSPAQCILLTLHYASSANIKALHSFTPTRLDALEPELVLRIILAYLPESTEPKEYITYVEEVASRLYLDYTREEAEVDIGPVKDLSEEQARKRVKQLHLPEIEPPFFPPHAPRDLLTRFLCHRAYRIDEQAGLLNLIPPLVEPFVRRNEYLRTWYISVVLPLLRLQLHYYPLPAQQVPEMGLSEFEKLEGRAGIDYLLIMGEQEDGKVPTEAPSAGKSTHIARDVKGLVGPWMYGHTERKRRRLDQAPHEHRDDTDGVNEVERGFGKIALDGVKAQDKTGHDWEYLYEWMVAHAQKNFPVVTHCIEDWDGPGDVDLGGFDRGGNRDYLDDEVQRKLELQYAQAAFAACYAAQTNSDEVVRGAHGILARLAELLDFQPPPDLASSVESLPQVERHATLMEESQTIADLQPDKLLEPEHPLTTPRLETYMLLQMMVYSAYQLAGLGHPISLVSVAKLHFYTPGDEQLAVMQKILRDLSNSRTRKDETQWTADRAKLIWLWNWGIDKDDESAKNGAGVLGKIDKEDFEKAMLKCFVEMSYYEMAIRLFITEPSGESRRSLPGEEIEQIVLGVAMEAYDGASNGNRMRGGVKRASDIIAAFRPHFRNSIPFRQASSLISATHALSFYSLTLQHGVPFKPVSIRVSSDPIGLLDKVLEQNADSYTKLDDLADIAQNLVSAGLPPTEDADGMAVIVSGEELGRRLKQAERRVTLMAVEAALREGDFETSYSYVVNRLTPSGDEIAAPDERKTGEKNGKNGSRASARSKQQGHEDDVSWRAAFLAGRYRPATSTPPTLRRLEQRTELLSLALLLAPASALPEILAVWRRCEEETIALQLSEQQAEDEFDDYADKRISTSTLPGIFTISGEQPELVLNQKRREMGRMTGATGGQGTGKAAGEDEAPMSMFDLTRSAARAFSRNAFPLRGVGAAANTEGSSEEAERGMGASLESLEGSEGSGGLQRVRKRDMVANAVSGGLASGLGWMLGAQPVQEG